MSQRKKAKRNMRPAEAARFKQLLAVSQHLPKDGSGFAALKLYPYQQQLLDFVLEVERNDHMPELRMGEDRYGVGIWYCTKCGARLSGRAMEQCNVPTATPTVPG
jgi:rubrerythrin